MLSTTLFTSLFAAVAVAQNTVNLLVQDSDNGPDDLVATLVSAGPSSTTYIMNCQSTLAAEDCGWGPGATFTVGSTSMNMVMSESDFTWSAGCSYDATTATAAVCTNYFSGSEANSPGSEVDVYGGDNGPAPWVAISITGAAAVSASTTASGSSATSSSSGTANTASNSATAKDTTTGSASGSVTGKATAQTSASKSTSSGSASSATSTGGMPQMTAGCFAIGGAAMIMAIAAL